MNRDAPTTGGTPETRGAHLLLGSFLVTALLAFDGAGLRAEPPTAPSPVARGAAARAEVARTVRIASLNIWGIPIVSRDLTSRLERLPAALLALDADIICLQEVWSASHQRQIARCMVKTHPHVAHAAGGLFTLSKLPMHGQRFTAFPSYPGLSFAERLGGKGYLETVHRKGGIAFRVFNTHLALAREANSPRTKQLGFVLAAAAKRKDAPLFLIGDLNTPSIGPVGPDPEFAPVLQAGFVDANPPRPIVAMQNRVGVRSTRMGWPREQGAISFGWDPDHLLARGTDRIALRCVAFTQALDTVRTALSDHDLLVATWSLHATPTPTGPQPRAPADVRSDEPHPVSPTR